MNYFTNANKRSFQLAVCVAAAVTAYCAYDYSAATNMRRADPELAYERRPTDPGAIAAVMNHRLSVQAPLVASVDDSNNTKIAVQHEPLNRTLIRTLAVQAELAGNIEASRKAMILADEISRRDTIAQMWLAEYYRRQNQPKRALSHFNAAMLVKPELERVLLPRMLPELKNIDFREALRPYLLGYVSWAVVLIGTANVTDPASALEIVEPLAPMLSRGPYNLAFSRMVHRLSVLGEHKRAMELAKNGFRDFSFDDFVGLGWNAATMDRRLGSLSWEFSKSGDVVATVNDDKGLSVVILPFTSGNAASRDILVNPGRNFRFQHKFRYDTPTSMAKLRWVASCLLIDENLLFWQKDVPTLSASGVFGAQFVPPSNCHLVRLSLRVLGADAQIASEVFLTDLAHERGAPTATIDDSKLP